jgi:hypothetical protein
LRGNGEDERCECCNSLHMTIPSKPVHAKALYNLQANPPSDLHPAVTGASSALFSQ